MTVFDNAVSLVIGRRAKEEVIRVYAKWVVTRMAD
jgi:hypothetical protein